MAANAPSKKTQPQPENPNPAWMLPVALAVTAFVVSIVGSLLLLLIWSFSSPPAAVRVDSAGNSHSANPVENAAPNSNSETSSANQATTPTSPPDGSASGPGNAPGHPMHGSGTTTQNTQNSSATARGQNAGGEREPAKPIEFDLASLEVVPVATAKQETPEAAATSDVGAAGDNGGLERLNIPFSVLGAVPSSDGRQLAVWGYDEPELPAGAPRRLSEQRPDNSMLAVVDLASREIIASRSIEAVISEVAFNATGLYVTAAGERSEQQTPILRLAAEDLKTIDRGKVAKGTLISIADKWLLSENAERRTRHRYALPSLELLDSKSNTVGITKEYLSARRLADGWSMDGAIWDDNLSTPKLLTSLPGFQTVSSNFNVRSGFSIVPYFQGYILHATNGKTPSLRNWRQDKPRFSPHVPAVMKVSDERGKIYFELADHHSGKVLRRTEVCSGSLRLAQVATTSKWIALTVNKNLFLLPTQLEQAPLKIPFRIEPELSTLVLSTSKRNRLTYRAEGATKFELDLPELTDSVEAYQTRSDDGVFTLDLKSALPAILQALHAKASKNRGYQGDLSAWAEAYLEKVREPFKRLTGRPPKGVPLALNAYVRAYDAELKTAVLHHIYLIDLPKSELKKFKGGTSPKSPGGLASSPSRPSSRPPSRPPRNPPGGATVPPLRTWTDTQGQTLQARFVRVEGQVVVVIDQQRRTLRIPIQKLSKKDRLWIASQNGAARGTP